MDIQSEKRQRPIWLLRPRGGEHYVITFFDKEIGEVFYMPGQADTAAAILLVPIIRQVAKWDLEWKEIVTKRKAIERGYSWSLELPFLAEDPVKDKTSNPEQKKERELSRDVIAVRKEPIWFLFHLENHPIVVPFPTTDGSDFILVVSAVYEVTNAVLAKTSVKNFLTFGEIAITAALGTIGRGKTFDTAIRIDQHEIKNHKVIPANASIDNGNQDEGEVIIEHLNRVKFNGKGFRLKDLEFVRVMIAPRSVDIQEAKETKQKAQLTADAFAIEQKAINDNIVKRGAAIKESLHSQLTELYYYEAASSELVNQTDVQVAAQYSNVSALTIMGDSSSNGRKSTKRLKDQILANNIQTGIESAPKKIKPKKGGADE